MKTALITGASRGLGRGIAMSLASQGFGLSITSRKIEDLEVVEKELLATGSPRVVTHPADMSDHRALGTLVQMHAEAFGTMNAMVANAGVGALGTVADFPLSRLTRTLEVNFSATVVLVKAALPLLRAAANEDQARGSRIIGMSSITGEHPEVGLSVYGASKAALTAYLEAVNLEESGNGVMATAIAPAYVDTDMAQWAADVVPVSSMLTVQDVVSVVDMVLGLSRNATITRIVIGRSGTSGYCA